MAASNREKHPDFRLVTSRLLSSGWLSPGGTHPVSRQAAGPTTVPPLPEHSRTRVETERTST